MTNRHSTKHALLTSIMALMLCFTMLLGTTYAWFTDSVTSKGNKIQAGTLKVDLELYNAESRTYSSIKESKAAVFTYDKWEPGYTDVKLFKVENEGTLALKWKATFASTNELSALANVIDVYVCPSATELTMPADRNLAGYTYAGTLATFINRLEIDTVGTLKPGEVAYLGIALKMQETAGNTYQNMELGAFDICILATQLNYEEDSIDADYDVDAKFAYSAQQTLQENASAVILEVRDSNDAKIGGAVVPAPAIENTDLPVEIVIKNAALNKNVTVAAGNKATTFDVTVLNLNGTTPVKVELRIDKGLDPDTVKLYHYETEIDCTYNPTTGYVTFESATFSPFTVEFDDESEYVAPEVPKDDEGNTVYPVATVTYEEQYVGEGKIQWGNYGQWSPAEGLEANLEAAFTFACPTDLDPEVEAAFENWYCDFYVSLDKALEANQIFLGGNYGDFGWVGFHNGDLTLAANEEIGLLEGVTTNPWTYADVRNYVGTFICGVGDVADALNGATFTVKLRLTNPENASEFYDVNVVTYTFGGSYTIQ